jgi:hypothetical protein
MLIFVSFLQSVLFANSYSVGRDADSVATRADCIQKHAILLWLNQRKLREVTTIGEYEEILNDIKATLGIVPGDVRKMDENALMR